MKSSVSTRLEEEVLGRLERIAEVECSNVATIIRRCVIRHLPYVEREVLGPEFARPIHMPEEEAV